MERFISHDERDAGFGICGALVDSGLVLDVDCPCCLDTFLVLDLEFENRVGLEKYPSLDMNINEPPPLGERRTFFCWLFFSSSLKA